jgi:hypothetical protein
MRRISFAVLSLALLLTLGFAQKNKAAAFTGEIMDSQCAGMSGHEMMMKDENAKDAKDCTIKCVQDGGKYALYDAKTKSVYSLDDQAKAKEFAGQNVKVEGTLDKKSHIIHVTGISPGS